MFKLKYNNYLKNLKSINVNKKLLKNKINTSKKISKNLP